ncbi:hypothetical protein [Spiroplasma endosymbiont of Polydrusus pterygomalis]
MNNSINIVAITSYSLQINDKEVSKKAKRREYLQRPEVKARTQKYNWRI